MGEDATLRCDVGEDGIATITFDGPGPPQRDEPSDEPRAHRGARPPGRRRRPRPGQ